MCILISQNVIKGLLDKTAAQYVTVFKIIHAMRSAEYVRFLCVLPDGMARAVMKNVVEIRLDRTVAQNATVWRQVCAII